VISEYLRAVQHYHSVGIYSAELNLFLDFPCVRWNVGNFLEGFVHLTL
jgi:hypothetical protein